MINHPFWGTTIFGNNHMVTQDIQNHALLLLFVKRGFLGSQFCGKCWWMKIFPNKKRHLHKFSQVKFSTTTPSQPSRTLGGLLLLPFLSQAMGKRGATPAGFGEIWYGLSGSSEGQDGKSGVSFGNMYCIYYSWKMDHEWVDVFPFWKRGILIGTC